MSAPTREQVIEWATDAGAMLYAETLCLNGKDADGEIERIAAQAYAAGQAAERARIQANLERFAPASVAKSLDKIEAAITNGRLPRSEYGGTCADLPSKIRLPNASDDVVGD